MERIIPMQRPRLLTPAFSALLLANVGFGYAFSSFFLLPKFMVVSLGAGPDDVGLVTAAHGAVVVLALPLIGSAVDRVGRRGFLIGGALLMAAASFGYAAVDEVGPLLYGLRLLQGVAFAMVFAAGGALAVDLAPPERLGQAIGVYGLSFLCMNAVGPLCVEQISGRAGWTPAFAAAALGALVCAALSLRIRDVGADGGTDGNGATLFQVARRPAQLVAMLVIALVGSAMSAVFNFHQLYALELGIEQVSAFFIAYSLSAIAVRGGLGQWIDVWGHRPSAIASLAFYVIVVGSVVWLDRLGLTLLGVGMGVAHGIFYPSYNAVVVAGVGARERGRIMAIFQAAFQVGMAGGGLGLGLLADARGYPIVFETAAAGLVMAWLVLVFSAGRIRSGSAH